MKLDPGIHIVMHSILFLKPGVTEGERRWYEQHTILKNTNTICYETFKLQTEFEIQK